MTDLAFDVHTALNFDPFAPAFRANPYTEYERLRASGPLQRTPVGIWVSPAHAVCSEVLRDPRFGHGSGDPELEQIRGGRRPEPAQSGQAPKLAQSFLFLDPPDHTRLRRLVSKAFSARMVERLRPRVQQRVDELIDAALGAGEVDLIAAFAYPLPVIVICELLGVPPADRDRFKAWSGTLARALDPDFLLPADVRAASGQALLELDAYFRELVARRRAEPADDLLSSLIAVNERDDVLSEEELLATCRLLLIAGHETTVNLIGNGALALLRHPDQLAYLRDHPAAGPTAVDELLRYDPPVHLTVRFALEDATIGGTRISRRDFVLMLIGAANRDPDVFADPDRLDLTRPAERHLALGLGIHFCLGAALARLEGEVALGTLVRRAPRLALLDDDPPYKDNLVLRGLESLPVFVG